MAEGVRKLHRQSLLHFSNFKEFEIKFSSMRCNKRSLVWHTSWVALYVSIVVTPVALWFFLVRAHDFQSF